MTTLDHIREEIKTLPPTEQFLLWRELGHNLQAAPPENNLSAGPAWDAEIASRAADIKSGKTVLVSGEEFERRTRSLFAELGIERNRCEWRG